MKEVLEESHAVARRPRDAEIIQHFTVGSRRRNIALALKKVRNDHLMSSKILHFGTNRKCVYATSYFAPFKKYTVSEKRGHSILVITLTNLDTVS